MPRKRSNKQAGDSLERLVAKHYEALGFRVTQNVNVGGHQIDLLAAKYLSGASEFTLMIEVKARSAAAVGINAVTPFVNTATSLLQTGDIQGAALVTNGSFSQDAMSAVRGRPGLRLLTVEELEQDLFNYSESLLRLKYEYESSSIFREYIVLGGERAGGQRPLVDVADYIARWSRGREKVLVLVGDFGSGKSTVLERVSYEQACQKLSDQDSRFPILLRLRKLLQYHDLWAFISASLRDSQMISPSRSAFWSKLTSGRLLVLLDGFDEIHTGATAKDRATYLKLLAPLLASPSPCVLTTRPTYFESFDEMTRSLSRQLLRAPAFERVQKAPFEISDLLERLSMSAAESVTRANLKNVVHLSQLTDDKIAAYLQKFDDELRRSTRVTSSQVQAFLYRIYDLEDLMKRPLLLHMVVFTVIHGSVDLSGKTLSLGPSTLYDLYTQICVKRDRDKNAQSQFLSEAERLQLCRRLAVKMLDKGVLELRSAEVEQAVSEARLPTVTSAAASVRAATLEGAVTDIRVCTFLSYSDDGSLRFGHKSFVEFFSAQELVLGCQLSRVPLVEFAHRRLSREILYFLGSFARDLEPFGRTVVAVLRAARKNEAAVTSLCQRIAFASGTMMSGVRVVGGTIKDVDLRKARVVAAWFDGVEFEGVVIRDVVAENWKIKGGVFRNSTIMSTEILKSELVLRAADLNIEGVALRETALRITGTDWAMRRSVITSGETSLGGSGLLKDVRFDGCERVTLEGDLRLAARSQVAFDGVRVVAEAEGNWYEEGATVSFANCVLAGLPLATSDIFGLARRSRDSEPRVTLVDCRGVVLAATLEADYMDNLREWYPGVVFCEINMVQRALNWRGKGRKATASGADKAARNRESQYRELLETLTAAIVRDKLERHLVGVLARVVPA